MTVAISTIAQVWGHMVGWSGAWMLIWGVFVTALFVGLIVWMVRTISAPSSSRPDPADRARAILAERYARGDLSSDEYRERVDRL